MPSSNSNEKRPKRTDNGIRRDYKNVSCAQRWRTRLNVSTLRLDTRKIYQYGICGKVEEQQCREHYCSLGNT